MRRSRTVQALRAVLLVTLALGVCGMHTLGHLDGRHGGSSAAVHGMKATPGPVSVVVPAGSEAFVPEREMPGLDPTDVCLAVLMSFVVLLLITAWTRVGRRSADEGRMPLSVRQVARPPPRLVSRRLAILSMLRI